VTALPPLSDSQRILLALKEARAKLDALEREQAEPMAIIGLAGRFPGGADTPEALWELLRVGANTVTAWPADRAPLPPTAPEALRWGSFLRDVDQFDPAFFRLTPREAIALDPQQRLLLEVSWEALECAGQVPERLGGSQTGVFIGITGHDYERVVSESRPSASADFYEVTGNLLNTAAGRLAYTFGLHGPCLAVDTACSSALTAIHLACNALRRRECDMALAGGVNLIFWPEGTLALAQALAPDGVCKTFDASANGYGRGEGCGIIVLKRLSEALAQSDHILAVIRASAINQDGPSSGLTVPNGVAQQALIRQALQAAKLQPADIDYVEAHGTGTALGDPIEMSALSAVFSTERPTDRPLQVGAVKANLSHLEAAAGMASLFKVILALQHEMLPPQPPFKNPSPHIDWSQPLVVPTEPRAWGRSDRPRLAGVSAFGVSGTNAHLIIQEAPPLPARELAPAPHLLTLSAPNSAALLALAMRVAEFLASTDEALADICFTANTGRGRFAHRLAVEAASMAEMRVRLMAFTRGEIEDGVFTGVATSEQTALSAAQRPLREVARAFVAGASIHWADMYPNAWRVPLPTYPFQRQRYWAEAVTAPSPGHRLEHPLLGARLRLADSETTYFEAHLAPRDFLAEHVVFGAVVFPGAGYIELALAAGRALSLPYLSTLAIEQALEWSDHSSKTIQTLVTHNQGRVLSYDNAGQQWVTHARFSLTAEAVVAPAIDLANWRAECAQEVMLETLYARYTALGLNYGPHFRGLTRVWRGTGINVLGEVNMPATLSTAGYVLHPALLDTCFHALGAAFAEEDVIAVPSGVAQVTAYAPLPARFFCRLRGELTGDALRVDVQLADPSGQVLAELRGLELRRATRASLLRQRQLINDGWYQLAWQPAAIASQKAPENVVILNDALETGEALLKHLQGHQIPVALFTATQPDWREAIKHASHIIGLWQADSHLICQRALELVQALPETATPRLLWVTRGAHALTPNDAPVQPTAAMLWGLANTIAQERPRWSVRCVDVDAFDSLVTELSAADDETHIAWHNGARFVGRLVRYTKNTEQETLRPGIRPDGTYLITGGLTGLGLHAAQTLVKNGARHLALLGRRAPSAETLTVLQALENAGVQVRVYAVDVADETQLRACLAEVARAQPPMRGLIHAAGVLADRSLSNLTWEDFEAVCAPKVRGTWLLHTLTREWALDFFVVYSSTASLLGSRGQANYAAANAYADALMHARRQMGLPGLSINWGRWSEIGLATQLSAADEARLTAQGIRAIAPEAGAQVLNALLGQSVAQVGVWPVHWPTLLTAHNGRVPALLRGLTESVPTTASETTFKTRLAALAAAQRAEFALNFIAEQIARIGRLPVAQVDTTRPLPDLGVDSLMATTLQHTLETEAGVTVPLSKLLQFTARELATQVVAEMAVVPAPLKIVSSEMANDELPLSLGQKALWFVAQTAPETPAYNTMFAWRVRSPLQVEALRRAWEKLLQRHIALRTVFPIREGEPLQQVLPSPEALFEINDATGLADAAVWAAARAAYQRPFNLERGPLARAHLFSLAPTDHVTLLVFHHIICDAWSMWQLAEELLALYASETQGLTADLPPLQHTYADFVRWQNDLLNNVAGEAQWRYWQTQLAGELPLLNLPTDRPHPPTPAYRGASWPIQFSSDLAARVRALAQAESATPFMVWLTAFQILLARYSGQADILIGSPTAGRTQAEFSRVVGYCVNPIVLRAKLNAGATFHDLLTHTRQLVRDGLEHQAYPFLKLVERLRPNRDTSRAPLFQVMFSYQRLQTMLDAGEALRVSGLVLEPYDLPQMEGQFDVHLDVNELPAGFSVSLKYNPDVFDEPTIARMAAHFETLLSAALAAPETPFDALPLLTPAELAQFATWNNTARDYDLTQPLHTLFEAQAHRAPTAPALTFGAETLTYAELDQRANRLAEILVARGVKPNTLIGVCLERSLEMVIALYGILKAGAAYVPIDPTYPPERVSFMAQDARTPLILTQTKWGHLFPDTPTLALDAAWPETRHAVNLPSGLELAYCIYTSGSTGRPKGALNTHRGIVNRLRWMQDEYRLTPVDVVLQKTPFSFDVSVWEFFWPLFTGARLVIAKPEGHKDAGYLVETIQRAGVTTIHFVPSMLQLFIEEPGVEKCASLRQIMCSGEALPYDLCERVWAKLPHVQLHNLYGPTEAAVDVTYWHCQPNSRQIVPIGRPVANTQMYVLDQHLSPVPIGVTGDLYIGGVQVGLGYLNRPELTREKFITAPTSSLLPYPSSLYKTGDLARYLSDGTLEYLGRADFQVKLRGLRIELGEIEARLTEHPAVREAVVILHGQGDAQRLVAYIVPRGSATNGQRDNLPSQLSSHLSARLPDYMLPAHYVVLPALPLSPSGKVDRAALPAPVLAPTSTVLPQTEVEQQIAAIWRETLNVPQVGLHDNFFDLGGHSLLLGKVRVKLERAFNRSFKMVELFQHPTVQTLARHIAPMPSKPVAPIASPPISVASNDRRQARLAARSRARA